MPLTGKFNRPRYLMLFCYKCGWAADLNRYTEQLENCPLCGKAVKLLWNDMQHGTITEVADARFSKGKWHYTLPARVE